MDIYTVGNFVLWRPASGAVNGIFKRISDDIPPQMKILNMVIPTAAVSSQIEALQAA